MSKYNMVMANKIKYNLKTREDISNPYHNFSHEQLLKAADVKILKKDEYTIDRLPNGKIILKEKGKKQNKSKK